MKKNKKPPRQSQHGLYIVIKLCSQKRHQTTLSAQFDEAKASGLALNVKPIPKM